MQVNTLIKLPLVAMMVLSLSACHDNHDNSSVKNNDGNTDNEALSIKKITAWVGKDSSVIHVDGSPNKAMAYLYSNADCDINNFTLCKNGQTKSIDSEIQNSVFTQQHSGFLTVASDSKNDNKTFQLSAESFMGRQSHSVVEHNGMVYLVGGEKFGAVFNDVWSSIDGVNWTQLSQKAEFSGRKNHQLASFNGKLWLFGGVDKIGEPNDIWSSTDGKSWQKVTSNLNSLTDDINEFELLVQNDRILLIQKQTQANILASSDGNNWYKVTNNLNLYKGDDTNKAQAELQKNDNAYDFTVLNDKVWAFGTSKDDKHNDVWVSNNAEQWQLVTPHAHFQGHEEHEHKQNNVQRNSTVTPYHNSHHHENLHLTSHNNKLWLVGGTHEGKHNEVLVSEDGKNWKLLDAEQSFGTESGYQVVSFDDSLWFIGGYGNFDYSNDVWSTKDGSQWKKLSTDPNFTGRNNYPVVNFKGALWIIGGLDYTAGVKNDVWRSVDGLNWEQVVESAAFPARNLHQVVVYNEKLWLIGGKGNGYANLFSDVWMSEDGKNWTQVTNTLPFGKRSGHQLVVHNNQILMIGGEQNYHGNNDVWSSKDGKNWTQLTQHAAFSARAGHRVVSSNNKLYLIGGATNAMNQSDVWSSVDGITWTQESAMNQAFNGRSGQTVTAFDGKIWLIGGMNGFQAANDVWSSTDGKKWTLEVEHAAFKGRAQHNVVVYDNKLWLLGGFNMSPLKDVWRSDDAKAWFKGYRLTN